MMDYEHAWNELRAWLDKRYDFCDSWLEGRVEMGLLEEIDIKIEELEKQS